MADTKTKYDKDYCRIVIPSDDDIWEENVLKKINEGNLRDYSTSFFSSLSFARIEGCSTKSLESPEHELTVCMKRFCAAVYRLSKPMVYGVISNGDSPALFIGTEHETMPVVRHLLEGTVFGVKLDTMNNDSLKAKHDTIYSLTGIPITKVDEEEQYFNLSTIMRNMIGTKYFLMILAVPKPLDTIVSDREKLGTQLQAHLKNGKYTSGVNVVVYNASRESQNSQELRMASLCEEAIERFTVGEAVGMWSTSVIFGSDEEGANILGASLKSELYRPSKGVTSWKDYRLTLTSKAYVDVWQMLPRIKKEVKKGSTSEVLNFHENPMLTPITSEELGMICTLPYEPAPSFDLRFGKYFPLSSSFPAQEHALIGSITNGQTPFPNMPFAFSKQDLNKHTFVCGITGSGKTNTVKTILRNCEVPFLVIEPAKTEYRSMNYPQNKPLSVYTLGRPDQNCLQFNPFFIPHGITLQTHVDYLKDLFNASFAFYGPMPFILEKCLYRIYEKRGWNTVYGFHPDIPKATVLSEKTDYSYAESLLFPTMKDLKHEVELYVEELKYDGELGSNIKAAMIARLDSLCVGAKGYMFNTAKPLDMQQLLGEQNGNTVIELEGLSDDSDKAFCVGLFIIYIDEYRRVGGNCDTLRHLLVIEEAHRLLKNVETERMSDSVGNPKGKAVEHFTNMIAELRSYGQGVIIAEQIPSKLAPEVIKNTSNKIIHRLVSLDDQKLVANTIGMNESDAIFLGNLLPGQTLCHKEGMSLPVQVKVYRDENPSEKNPTTARFEPLLSAMRQLELFTGIDTSTVAQILPNRLVRNWSYRILTAFECLEAQQVLLTISEAKHAVGKELDATGVRLLRRERQAESIGMVLAEQIARFLIVGQFKLERLPDNALFFAIKEALISNCEESIVLTKAKLAEYFDSHGPRARCLSVCSSLIRFLMKRGVEYSTAVKEYFFFSEMVEEDLQKYLKEWEEQ